MSRGFLFIISGPSGAGKGTLADRLVEELDDLVLSVSCTTRPPRPGEVDGKHYFFLTEEEFVGRHEAGGFIECAKVHEKWMYGTPEDFVRENLDAGRVVVLEIDVQGFREVMEVDIEKVSTFVSPTEPGELVRRISARAPMDDEEIARRMTVADEEYEYVQMFDYFIVNDDLDAAVKEIVSVVTAERCRTLRMADKIKEIIILRGKKSNA